MFLDGNSSHITRQAIRFCEEQKIVLFCLPSHLTHILQPLDIGIFGPLAHTYEKVLEFSSRLGAEHNIDKLKFLQLYQEAKEQVICKDLILSAFQKCGYKPWNPSLVLHSLPSRALKIGMKARFEDSTSENASRANIRTQAPVEALVNKWYKSTIPPTPKKPNQVDELLAQAVKVILLIPLFISLVNP